MRPNSILNDAGRGLVATDGRHNSMALPQSDAACPVWLDLSARTVDAYDIRAASDPIDLLMLTCYGNVIIR
jgi:hypothetical protein